MELKKSGCNLFAAFCVDPSVLHPVLTLLYLSHNLSPSLKVPSWLYPFPYKALYPCLSLVLRGSPSDWLMTLLVDQKMNGRILGALILLATPPRPPFSWPHPSPSPSPPFSGLPNPHSGGPSDFEDIISIGGGGRGDSPYVMDRFESCPGEKCQLYMQSRGQKYIQQDWCFITVRRVYNALKKYKGFKLFYIDKRYV
jgi:hypothetical protein